jgi:hypothetical protein
LDCARVRDRAASLIAQIELILDEQGIERTPCLPLDDQDDP